MKILAAIMDISFVKPWFREFKITKIKRCLVYDPKMVVPKDRKDERAEQIR